MNKVIKVLVIILLLSLSYKGKSQISQDLRNLKWSNMDKYVIYGHTIQPIFGDISWVNKFGNPPKTNIAYKTLPQLIDDLKYQAQTEKWDSVKLNKEMELLKKSAVGGRIYLYLDRTTSDLANLRYFFAIVRDMDPKLENELFKTYFKQNEPYIITGDRFASEVTFDINKSIPDSFYVYINDNQTEAMQDYKFKVITGKKSQKFVSMYPNNQVKVEGVLENGLQTGKWVKYYENGKEWVVENYKNGKLDGKAVEYFDDGRLMAERNYKNGLKEGNWKQYFNKLLFEGNYQNDKREGLWKFYDVNGNPKANGSYKNDLRDGKWIYYQNNRIESEGDFSEDFENGEWKIYDTIGNVIAKGTFNKGKEVPGTWSYFLGNEKIALDTNVSLVVEVMPQFRDGVESMKLFIKNNALYPPSVTQNKTAGKVFISFIVEPNGTLSNITILKGVSSEVDNEILRVFSIMPRWIPGIQGGKPVRVKLNMPISIEP